MKKSRLSFLGMNIRLPTTICLYEQILDLTPTIAIKDSKKKTVCNKRLLDLTTTV